MITRVKLNLSGITSAHKRREKDNFWHYVWYPRILSRFQDSTLEHKIYGAEEIHKIKKCSCTKLKLMTRYTVLIEVGFRRSLLINTVSVSTDCDFFTPNVVPLKAPQKPNQPNQALLNNLNFFLRSGSITMYNIFSGLNPSFGHTPTD